MLAAGVAELDADDHESGRGELVAPTLVVARGRFEEDHPATVGVQDAGQRPGGLLRPGDVQGDVVAVDAGDDLDRAGNPGHRLDTGEERVADRAEALLALVGVGMELIERIVDGERERLDRTADAERGERAIIRGSALGSSANVMFGLPKRPGRIGAARSLMLEPPSS